MDETLPQIPAPPKVSVIFVSHNHATELPRAVEALKRSSNRDEIEIIVVDCGSTDETSSLEFDSVNILRLPQNFGATKAMNIGTRTARADLLFFLSPEVEIQPDTIARLCARLEEENSTSAICPEIVDATGNPAPRLEPKLSQEIIHSQCYGNPRLPLRAALMVRRQFVLGMNYLDERFGEYWADMDLATKIARAQRKIVVDPDIRVALISRRSPPSDTEHKADRILGAALLLRKYRGFFAGLGFRFNAVLKALGKFDFGLLGALLSGRKIGSEAQTSRPL